MINELEEEFFRVEGRPAGTPECAYVNGLVRMPNGDGIRAAERAALWYLAYSIRDGVARISLANLAAHIDSGPWETRTILTRLIDGGVLRIASQMAPLEDADVFTFVFPELLKAEG